MSLVLNMLRCPDGVPPETRRVEHGELSIGRGKESDWTLPDPERILSKRHCVIARRGEVWEIADTSTNGISINHEPLPLGRHARRVLRDGDRLVLGSYEIEVSLRDQTRASYTGAERSSPVTAAPGVDDTTAGEIDLPDSDRLGIALSLASEFDEAVEASAQPYPIADHAPVSAEHFRAPSVRFDLLPEDWDRNEGSIATPREAPRAPEPPPPEPPPQPPERAVEATAGLPASDAYSAFLAGAGVSAPPPADVHTALRELGHAFRRIVSDLRRIMMTRAAIKGEFRIERTMIQPSGNNPLKFSADDDEALRALLGTRRPGDMAAERALGEAMRDLRMHELAVSAAMQQATRDLLIALAPASLLRDLPVDSLDKLPGAHARRKARAWDSYAALHERTVQALADDFDSVFGKSFVRAYECAMAELRAQDLDAP